ncbi:MAG: hypothetical protein HYR96_01000 [Deltaproteobacteria bacterium]|nr:hypothetical protein [Deltaproteobacteria bacterium]MBI3293421.1 hypothetical protein [Deltaproteobacteria bacterium]
MKKLVLVVVGFVSFALPAKNLDSRFGFGVATTDFDNLGMLSLRYHIDHFLSTAIQVGFNTDSAVNATRIGAKILRNVSMEENANFFLGAGLFVIADQGKTATLSTGIELDGLIGMEFFFSGLPNLGISVETGLALRSVRAVTFSSLGTGFGAGAVHYYF